MDHAFECLGPCPTCGGSGVLPLKKTRRRGKGRRKSVVKTTGRVACKQCEGSGDCGHEWRGGNPPAHPCRNPDCCACGKKPCDETWCQKCFAVVNGEVVRRPGPVCFEGGCPACGHKYAEWLSAEAEALDVYLVREYDRDRFPDHPVFRQLPMGSLRIQRKSP